MINVGAVTFGSGTTSLSGAVSATNSLVGTTADDAVGAGGVTALTNGNYVVRSGNWDNGAATNASAVTFGSGTTGVSGAVSDLNSLVGTTANDNVGNGGVTALSNGNYVVSSPNWDNGGVINVGAVTFGSGTTGVSGAVSATNSLVGTTANDAVGFVVPTAFSNGNYVVSSTNWDNGGVINAGAVTFGSGTTGVSGAISATNSLVGTTANDQVGIGGASPLSNGNVVVRSPLADNGTIVDAGLAHVLSPGGGGGFTNPLTFADNTAATSTITPAQITAITNTGTAVVLQANTDITLAASSNIVTNNPGGAGGAITMQAGRSVLLNSSITTDNGNLTITANDAGAQAAHRDAGAGGITMMTGTSLNAGTGTVALTVGTGVLGAAGSIAVENILAGGITLTANGALSDIGLNASGGISTTGTAVATLSAGRDIVLRGAIRAASGSLGLALNAGNEVRTPGGATLTLDGGAGGLIATVNNGKTWQNSGTITMQGNSQVHLPASGGVFAALSNNDGATLNVNSTNGFAFFSSSVLQGGIINNAGTLNLNQSTSFEAAFTNAGTGALNIAGGKLLSMQNGQTIAGSVDIGLGGTLWASERHGNNAFFNGTAITGSGTLLVETGLGPIADFSNVTASGIRLSLGSGGTANILSGSSTFGSLNLAGGTLAGAGALTLAAGTSSWTGGTMTGSGSTTLASGAILNVNSAGTLIASRVLDNLGTVNVNGGTLQVDNFASATNKGTLNIASGATLSTNSASLINASTGVLSGLGTLDLGGAARTLTNNGRIAPGTTSTTGTLTVNGNIAFGAGSSFDVRLGGAGVGQFDKLAVTGAASLNGRLNATTTGGFTPNGESFPVLTYLSRTGTFGTLNLPASFSNTYNTLDLTLTHTPGNLPASGGYFDSVEREFRGFARVEQIDTESYLDFAAGNIASRDQTILSTLASIGGSEWAWMPNYRVWEANRKVFLFPENWNAAAAQSPYSVYNWEDFFTVPLAIATQLSSQDKFADANAWSGTEFDDASARFADMLAALSPQARAWVEQEAARARASNTVSEAHLSQAVRSAGSEVNLVSITVDDLVQMIMMQISRDADEDMRQLLADMKTSLKEKATREAIEKQTAAKAPVNSQLRQEFVGKQARPTIPRSAALDDFLASQKVSYDSLGDMSQEQQLKLQMALEHKSKAESAASNVMKKTSDTESGIIRNIK